MTVEGAIITPPPPPPNSHLFWQIDIDEFVSGLTLAFIKHKLIICEG